MPVLGIVQLRLESKDYGPSVVDGVPEDSVINKTRHDVLFSIPPSTVMFEEPCRIGLVAKKESKSYWNAVGPSTIDIKHKVSGRCTSSFDEAKTQLFIGFLR